MRSRFVAGARRKRLLLLTLVVIALPMLWFQARAQESGEETPLTEQEQLCVEPAQEISESALAEMEAAAAAEPVEVPDLPFRPAMDEAEYRNLKETAAAGFAPVEDRSAFSPETSAAEPAEGETEPLAPGIVHANFNGVEQVESCGTCRPPDTHGAAGLTQFVEITNSNLTVFSKTTPFTKLRSVRLNTFLGYTRTFVFDPRVVYDSTWNRWVVLAEAFPESPTVQRIFLAISRTADATGAWFVYSIDINIFNNDDFFDYPQLGMDQDAVVVTGNVFGPGSFRGARMFAVAKARLYNGLGFSVPLWINLQGSLAPPMVLDQSARTHLVSARPVGNTIFHYTLRDSAHAFDQTLSVAPIFVPFYTVPPDARQPGTPNVLDTLDARFQNAGTQVGSRLFQVHTVALGPFATPRWYELNMNTNSVSQLGHFFANLVSEDFNPSIAANAAGDVYVTWSSTQVGTRFGGGVNAQVRFSGRRNTDLPGVIGPGGALFTSPSNYLLFRWGDYSAVTVDPVNPQRAWLVNESIINPTRWGTRIGSVGF